MGSRKVLGGHGFKVVFLAISAAVVGCSSNPEPTSSRDPLTTFLSSHSEYHLLVRNDWSDKVHEEGVEESPKVLVDTTGDQIPDLTAVIVRTTGGQRLFSVVSFTGVAPGELSTSPIWVLKDDRTPLLGVMADSDKRAIIPLGCQACDANASYHWVGDAYDASVFPVGSVAFPTADSKAEPRLFASADENSPALSSLHPGTALRVLGYGPRYSSSPRDIRRWHRVDCTVAGKDLTGFVKAEALISESDWDQYQELVGLKR